MKNAVICTLPKKGLITVMELHKYFIEKGVTSMDISKQDFLQQRKN